MLKHLNPPIAVNTTWEEVRCIVKGYPEYEALEEDFRRIEVFQKRIKKLKVIVVFFSFYPPQKRLEEVDDREEGEVLQIGTSNDANQSSYHFHKTDTSRGSKPYYSRSRSREVKDKRSRSPPSRTSLKRLVSLVAFVLTTNNSSIVMIHQVNTLTKRINKVHFYF